MALPMPGSVSQKYSASIIFKLYEQEPLSTDAEES